MALECCDQCGSLECKGECASYEFCEHCGSVGCKGQCQRCPQCGKAKCKCPLETPGEALARRDRQGKEGLLQSVVHLADAKLFPRPRDLPAGSAEEFAANLAKKRPRTVVAVRKDTTQYRRKP